MADDPRAHGDVFVAPVSSGFFVGAIHNPSGLAATSTLVVILDDFADAVRLAQSTAARAGTRAWLAEGERYTRLPDVD